LTYQIKDWYSQFENNRTRELKRMDWVPVPNKMDGLGYTELVDHPNGAAHLGAWLAIIEIASRQKVRGTLPQDGAGLPQGLARISRLPAGIFEEVIPRLLKIGWIQTILEVTDIPREGAGIPQEGAGIPQEGAGIPREGAGSRTRAVGESTEGESTEGNSTEGEGMEPAAPILPIPIRRKQEPQFPPFVEGEFDIEAWFECRYADHPKKGNRGLALRYCQEAIAGGALPQEIDLVHKLWCESEAWTDGGGKFVKQNFAEWILDKGWKYLPPARARHDSKNDQAEMILLANLEAKARLGAQK